MARIKAGDRFPDLKFDTAFKEGLSVSSVLKGRTIFWVLRYIGCTSCNFDVALISESYDKFLEKNAQVFVVMQSDKAHLRDDLEKRPVPFDIISDPDFCFYKELDIRAAKDKEELGGTPEERERFAAKRAAIQARGLTHGDYEGDELQLPAMFIVGKDGTVLDALYPTSLMDMPTIDEVLAKL